MRLLVRLGILMILCNSNFGIAQTSSLWGNLNCPLKYFPQHIYYDTIQNEIFLAGTDSSGTAVIGNWDGTTWSQLGTAPCSNNLSFINYNSEVLLANSCLPSIVKWDGLNWIPFAGILPDAGVNCFLQNGNDLYVGGYFNTVGGSPMRSVAKWNGTAWSGLGSFPYNATFGTNKINSLAFYMSDLYACGLFPDNLGNVMNIARWDGTNWQPVGGGIVGGTDDAVEMLVFNGELYVAGTFTIAHGNSGNYIQKWNGSTWSDVGGGVIGDFGGNGQISDIEIFNNELYATGVFTYAGGIPALQIAKWDGINWCTLGEEIKSATCLTKSNTDLYVGWFFKILSEGAGDTTGSVIKWIGGSYTDSCGHMSVGIDELQDQANMLNVYPNPTEDFLTIKTTLIGKGSIEVRNTWGQILMKQPVLLNGDPVEINAGLFPQGIYFLSVSDGEDLAVVKFVKE